MSNTPLTVQELEEHIEKYLDPVLSSRRTALGPAQSLLDLTRSQQEFVLHWISVTVKTNSEMGYQFAAYAAQALRLMDAKSVEEWLIHAMDTYDKRGLYPGCAEIQAVERYAQQSANKGATVAFDEVAGVLQSFLCGLSGRKMTVVSASTTYTDTEVLHVPEQISVFGDRQQNFALYKSLVTYLWAQNWYGTFDSRPHAPDLSEVIAEHDDFDKARKLFHALETVRLNANIASELDVLHREMLAMQRKLGDVKYSIEWQTTIDLLRTLPNDVTTTYEALHSVYEKTTELPKSYCFQGELLVEETERRIKDRQLQEKLQFQNMLIDVKREQTDKRAMEHPSALQTSNLDMRPKLSEAGELIDFELSIDNQPISLSPQARALTQSIFQDFGEIPSEYMVPAGDGGYQKDDLRKCARDVWMGTYREEGAYLYNEWDCRRQHYRKDWCVLRELEVHPQDTEFVTRTLARYSHLISDMRKSFEALRGEDKLLRKQKHGNDVDIDAVVEAFADNLAGLEMSDRLFMKLNKLERDMAVVFMVDMSGSTKGWINEAEREALVLLCESLEVLGDRYAIYGFSGMTRKRCELYRVKTFEESYDEQVKQRISGITPQDYTRMGVTIRHLTWLLRNVEARTKLLVTLSDGKPDDYDGYRGEYGIEDTRQALIEAKNEGIHPFCITIDSEARDYLPRMYGAVNYVLVDEIRKLPLKVSDIYRRLTA